MNNRFQEEDSQKKNSSDQSEILNDDKKLPSSYTQTLNIRSYLFLYFIM